MRTRACACEPLRVAYSISFDARYGGDEALTKEDLLQRIRGNLEAAIRFYQKNATLELGVLRELGKDLSEPGVPLFLASMPNTPSRILEQLLNSEDPAVLQALSWNANFLHRLVGAPSKAARLAAAGSRKLSQPQAQQLAQDAEVDVRAALARNPVIPPPVQLRLSQDPVPFVRAALLENRRLVEEFQVGLADDIDTVVHLSALLVPKLSAPAMEIWAKEGEELAQLALSRRKGLPPAIVAVLAQSPHPAVLLSLLEHQQLPPESLEDFARRGDRETALALLRRTELSEGLQRALLDKQRQDSQVCLALAAHPSLCDDVALALLDAPSGDEPPDALRQALALNPAPGLLQTRIRLAREGGNALRKRMLANPQCHQDAILEELVLRGDERLLCHLAYRRIDCQRLSPQARQQLLKCPLPAVQKLAAQQQQTTASSIVA